MTKRGGGASVRIRKGRLTDLEQVKDFTKNTFSWGDYLPAAWAGWVRSKRGVLLVAVIGSQVVGTCHLRLLENREAWLEGLRVHHEFRKQGVASKLIQAIHEHASRRDCRVIRLETASHNLGAQHAFENFGYRRVVPYGAFNATARHNASVQADPAGVRRATMADLGACWELWQKSWLKRASKGIIPAPYGWRWWELTRTRLADEIKRGRVWVSSGGFLVLRTENDAFDVTLLVGSKRAAVKLLEAARELARREKKDKAWWVTPHVRRSTQWAADAGYTLDEDGLLIYACAL